MKLLLRSFAALYIFALLINGGQSADEKLKCAIFKENGKILSDDEWDRGIEIGQIDDTTPAGTIIKTFKTENISSVYSQMTNGKYDSYLQVDKLGKDDVVYIKIHNDFNKYEEYETAEKMSLKIEFKCGNDLNNLREIEIRIPIKDTNNHSPRFLKKTYEYKLPMPLPKKFVFDTINEIVARDVDLTNKAIDFALKGHDKYNKAFLITGLEHTKEDKKNYPARIETSMTVDFYEDTTFILSATDSGKPSRTTNTTLSIIVDKANSFPRFAEPVYVADLTDLKYNKVDKILLRFLDDKNITLDRGYERPVDFSLSGLSDENKKHFEVTSSGPSVYIELKDLTDKFFSQKAISAILTASKETAQTSTAILILLPEVADKTEETTNVQEPSTEEDSTNGYMISTIILSLTSVGLLGYVIYLHLYGR